MTKTDREQHAQLSRLVSEYGMAKRQVGAGVAPEPNAIRAEALRLRILTWGYDALAGRLPRGDEDGV